MFDLESDWLDARETHTEADVAGREARSGLVEPANWLAAVLPGNQKQGLNMACYLFVAKPFTKPMMTSH